MSLGMSPRVEGSEGPRTQKSQKTLHFSQITLELLLFHKVVFPNCGQLQRKSIKGAGGRYEKDNLMRNAKLGLISAIALASAAALARSSL